MTAITDYPQAEFPRRHAASWGAIAGGVVTALAVAVLFSLLAAGLGLGQVEAQTSSPLAGVWTAFGWTSVLGLALSLAAGGFVAGRLAGVSGFTHGFLTWAVALLLGASLIAGTARLTASAAGTIVSAAGQTVGAVASAAGDVAGGVASAASDAAGAVAGVLADGGAALADAIEEHVIEDVDLSNADQEIQQALGQVEIEELAPANLEAEVAGARSDVEAAISELRSSPSDFDQIAGDLVASLQARAEAVAGEFDRENVIGAIQANTDLTRAEAEAAADEAIAAYEGAVETVQAQIAATEQAVADAQRTAAELRAEAEQRLAELEAEARRQADEAAAAASRGALWTFFGAGLGAVVAGFAGLAGQRSRQRPAL